ncbi:MAG: class I SAM-dependent methyltransferase [Flavobacterium sp.]|uniref:O-methyltransferase n=1 Tax=Flavobacterium sp. TaxID=239 RepID=UPI0022CB0071|nr:class I SAM-dependent methyltransferase [Flavobacterium sp.]MCZ8090926.1 class I SAM-dependent methyltransferase [Flavobacterium sp.]MCZ8332427.1 class I SAM-dependent methyltransferase [Flavobacterium sp.]
MLQQIKSYLKFLYNSKNQHGVHSPFVFNLVTKCFYDKTKHPEYFILKNYRKSLLENHNFIEVTDFGAGSRIFKSNKRQISKIAKTAGISPKRAELLFRIAKYFQPETILEIGTSLGLATSALSLGNSNAKITTLEGCPNTLAVAKNQISNCHTERSRSAKFQNIEYINTEFSTFLKNFQLSTLNSKPQIFDLVYFDGNHSKQATLDYFELLLPTITNETVWIFDDIHWSLDMEEAWETIKNHPDVNVTIDTFQWGIVFFRAEQEKEHFIIRV